MCLFSPFLCVFFGGPMRSASNCCGEPSVLWPSHLPGVPPSHLHREVPLDSQNRSRSRSQAELCNLEVKSMDGLKANLSKKRMEKLFTTQQTYQLLMGISWDFCIYLQSTMGDVAWCLETLENYIIIAASSLIYYYCKLQILIIWWSFPEYIWIYYMLYTESTYI